MTKRSKREIKEEIIFLLAEEGTMGKTKLMYKTNTCWKLINQLLEELTSLGLITSQNLPPRDNRFYSLTSIGARTEQNIKAIRAILG